MNKIRVADYIAQRCVDAGASHVFLVTGGGAMFLNDAFGRNKKLTPVCFHHEQAASMAAESYYRTSRRLAILNTTTGPGGINALNGVYGAYVDSLAMLVVSGQVKVETHYKKYSIPLRQLGDQEVDIVSIAKPIVKYATLLDNPKLVKQVMDKAIFLTTNGRPGPVWIDVPIDIQSSQIDIDTLMGWDGDIDELLNDPAVTDNTKLELTELRSKVFNNEINLIIEKLTTAVRPVVFAGAGIRISGQYDNFIKLVSLLGIPAVTGWNAHDALPNSNNCYAGRPGTVGDRAGNFTVQNSDFLLVLGSRLNIRQVSYNWKNFASNAYKIMVDADKAELDKPTLNIDLKICADLKDFLPALITALENYKQPVAHSNYLEWCKHRVKKYHIIVPEFKHGENFVNPYIFVDELIKSLNDDDIIVTGNGSACVISFQTAQLKTGQRLYTNSGNASMGYDLPAAIGACLSTDKNRVFCLTGDGSIMMNIQELQTLVGYSLPVKIIILNNYGYVSIKQTQQNYFSDNVFGTCPNDGVTMPEFTKVGEAFGIESYKVSSMEQWHSDKVQNALTNNSPVLIEIICDPSQIFQPKLAAKKLTDGSLLAPSLENMSPFLSDEEMISNKI